jgi:hypothetical protein
MNGALIVPIAITSYMEIPPEVGPKVVDKVRDVPTITL